MTPVPDYPPGSLAKASQRRREKTMNKLDEPTLRQRANAEALEARNKAIAAANASAALRTGVQPQPNPTSPPTVGAGHMAQMSDIDLEALATTDMLPQVHTPTSNDYLALANAKAARAELFKRALAKPMVIRPGHAP
jgi:hypothetical protein